MILFNTTFHVEDEVHNEWINWVKETYIPTATESGLITDPLLCKVLNHHDTGSSYSLQFKTDDTATLHRWYANTGNRLQVALQTTFGTKVLPFTSLLEVVEL